jgi:hypothetical protein
MKIEQEQEILNLKALIEDRENEAFKKLVMALPEEECQWCTDDGECLFYMPDSMFLCKGRCQEFTKRTTKEDN